MISRKRKSPSQEIFESKDYGVSNIRHYNGFVAQLYRSILAKLNVTQPMFNRCLTTYYKAMQKLGYSKPADRGNVAKALLSPEMTWKTFCKGLPIIGVEEIQVSLTFKTKDGQTHFIDSGKIAFSIEHDAFKDEDELEFIDLNKDEYGYVSIPKEESKGSKKVNEY